MGYVRCRLYKPVMLPLKPREFTAKIPVRSSKGRDDRTGKAGTVLYPAVKVKNEM